MSSLLGTTAINSSSGTDTERPRRRSVKLCAECDQIGLTPARFLIRSSGRVKAGGAMVAPTCLPKLQSGNKPSLLGTYSKIKEKAQACSFCRLVSATLSRYSNVEVQDSTQCWMDWEVDGREREKAEDGYSNLSRRIRLCWRVKATDASRTGQSGMEDEQEAYLLYVQPPDANRAKTDIQSVWNKEQHFLARDFDSKQGVQALVRSWLDVCATEHRGLCCSSARDSAFLAMVRSTSFGVIDVVNYQLVQLPIVNGEAKAYVALSYVWGGGKEREEEYRTLRSNVMTRIQAGGLEMVRNHLPLTINDAIQLVRDLGERYLWVDALCIVQDSSTSWQVNSSNMDLVYGNAEFTICAADGVDSDAGLAATTPARMDVPLSEKMSDWPNVRLLVTRPLEKVICLSTWNQRAWTFQERILSRRCLIYVGRRVYFQCRSTNMSQDIYPDGSGKGWSSDWRNSPLRTLGELDERPIWFYTTCVALYTGRRLTHARDILPAFEGVSKMMIKHLGAPFLFGLPSSHFDYALLWEPVSGQRRRLRRPRSADCEQDEQGRCICHQEESWCGHLDFPSWAWCGWEDAHDRQKGAPAAYKATATLLGVTDDLHEWLLEHTWINWFVRDQNGDLLPVWPPANPDTRPESGQLRWRGYLADSLGREKDAREGRRGVPSLGLEQLGSLPDTPRSPYFHPPARPRLRQEGPVSEEFLAPDHMRRGRGRSRRRSRRGSRRRSPGPPQHHPPGHDRGSQDPGQARPLPVIDVYTYPSPLDDYGRRVRSEIRAGRQSQTFGGILPDNPFGVRGSTLEARDRHFSLVQPILQFHTWRARFYVLRDAEGPAPGDGLVRCHVADAAGDWCGSVVLNQSWIDGRDGERHNFIALSDAKSFTERECANWTHYIPKDRDNVEWDLFYVLLVTPNRERLVWERVGLGKAFKAAFAPAGWEEIKLG